MAMAPATQWPKPGKRDPAPTAALQLLQDFVNTNDIESDRDAVRTPQRLARWLGDMGVAGTGPIDEADWRRALEIREGLRALGQANAGDSLDELRVGALNRAAAAYPVLVSVDVNDWSLRPAEMGVSGFLGTILSTVARSMADGTWSRVKACRNDECRWLFFDQSRNRSGTWCTMKICGSRMKSRAYRSRRRAASA
jgi:predicted RNA-binding Zn ribbon-like protein